MYNFLKKIRIAMLRWFSGRANACHVEGKGPDYHAGLCVCVFDGIGDCTQVHPDVEIFFFPPGISILGVGFRFISLKSLFRVSEWLVTNCAGSYST